MAGPLISRRSMVGLGAVLGLSGCGDDPATKVANDPYLPTMMRDPLYTWRPAGNLLRTESLFPRSTDKLAGGTAISSILIKFSFQGSGDPEALLQEAISVRDTAGYVDGKRSLMPGVRIASAISIADDRNGILISMNAPS